MTFDASEHANFVVEDEVERYHGPRGMRGDVVVEFRCESTESRKASPGNGREIVMFIMIADLGGK